jgi:hypothetical protein
VPGSGPFSRLCAFRCFRPVALNGSLLANHPSAGTAKIQCGSGFESRRRMLFSRGGQTSSSNSGPPLADVRLRRSGEARRRFFLITAGHVWFPVIDRKRPLRCCFA